MASPSVSVHFVRALLRGAERRQVDTGELLRSAGVAPDLIERPQARIDAARYTALVQQTWLALQDEYMGFASVRSKPGTFAAMGYLVIHCQTLESVYKRAANFYALFDQPICMQLEIDENEVSLVLHSEGALWDPDHFFQESLLVIWHRFSSWLLGERIQLDKVCFDYPEPTHVGEYQHLFSSRLCFDEPRTRLCFHKRYLGRGLAQDERTLKEFLKSSPADLLAKPEDHSSYTARIRKLLSRDLSSTPPDFEQVADSLAVSPQTLRRRLRQENTSFQEIKDHLRRDVALYYLARPELSINEIAFRVGFTEPSTFHRAFKKWTGLTPGEYRENPAPAGMLGND